MSLYLGNEKNDGDYPRECSLRVSGKPYNVQHNRCPEQRDKLKPVSMSCDPQDRRNLSPIAAIEEHRESPAPKFQIGR